MKRKMEEIFGCDKAVIGMIHTKASPGTPKYKEDVKSIVSAAVAEAEIYAECGVTSVMIENMHDVPYLNRNVGPEVISLMGIVAYEVKNRVGIPVGIQILAGANKEALAVAKAAGLDYIRAEGFVFTHIADEGTMNSDAGELLRYRKYISADEVAVFTDVKKKHGSHQITKDVDIVETAKAAEYFLSDGVIITGVSTSVPADIEEAKKVSAAVNIPVLIGSGVTKENVHKYIDVSDALIVGSYFKEGGIWENPPEKKRILDFMNGFNNLSG